MQTQTVIQIKSRSKQGNTIPGQVRIINVHGNGDIECTFNVDGLPNSLTAKRAFSCVVAPELGDLVMVEWGGEHYYVLAILERLTNSNSQPQACISFPEQQEVVLEASKLTLRGNRGVNVQSQNDIELITPANVTLTASNLFTRVSQSLIQLASHHMTKANTIALTASKLLRSHGHHHLISADQDVKVDGERINMG